MKRREAGESMVTIARSYGVSHQTIGRLCEHPITISKHPSKGRFAAVARELSLQA
jgi:hypothetical protein